MKDCGQNRHNTGCLNHRMNSPTPNYQPLYGQIKSFILSAMESGEFKPGQMMPSEMELAQRYAVSQGTVRKAVDELAAENLVTRRQGKGTFVATHTAREAQYRFLRLTPDFGDQAAEGPAQRTVLACKKTRASADVARLLQLKSGEAVMHAQRLLALAGVPTIVEDIWLPAATFKNLTAQQLAHHPGSTYSLYETAFQTRMVRADEKIKALAASAEMAERLQVGVGTPLLHVERVACTYNGVPMELRRAHYRTDTHHYRSELS